MIHYIRQDVTKVEKGVIAHGVNCQGVMGSGVAKAIRRRWPIAYDRYKQMPTGKSMLGTAHIVNVSEDGSNSLWVANCYTQVFYGFNGRFANPDAILNSLWDALSYADYHHLDLYMPKIGAGLGGLDWETEVKPIVEEADRRWCRTDIYVCEWGN